MIDQDMGRAFRIPKSIDKIARFGLDNGRNEILILPNGYSVATDGKTLAACKLHGLLRFDYQFALPKCAVDTTLSSAPYEGQDAVGTYHSTEIYPLFHEPDFPDTKTLIRKLVKDIDKQPVLTFYKSELVRACDALEAESICLIPLQDGMFLISPCHNIDEHNKFAIVAGMHPPNNHTKKSMMDLIKDRILQFLR